MKQPVDFIGVGAPKAATTWIEQCLAEHPEICTATPKETNYFLEPNYSKGNEWYEDHFAHCARDNKTGEFSPAYFKHAEYVAPRISKQFPKAKLLISLRNPIERFVSQHYFEYTLGRHNYLRPEDLPEHQFLRTLNRGFYAHFLEIFYTHFPPEQILVIFYEDIKHKPRDVLRHIYSFLQVDPSFTPSCLEQSSAKTSSQPLHFRTLRQLYYRGHRFFTRNPIGRRFAPLIQMLGLQKMAKRIAERTRSHKSKRTVEKTISSELRAKLYSLYQDDIDRLEQLTGRALSNWR